MDAEQTLQEMVRRIVDEFGPERVILFGSRAVGQADDDSDVDLLVVFKDAGNRRAMRVAIRKALSGMGVPKDIVVLTSEEFAIKRNIPGTLAYPADKEGRILYAA